MGVRFAGVIKGQGVKRRGQVHDVREGVGVQCKLKTGGMKKE